MELIPSFACCLPVVVSAAGWGSSSVFSVCSRVRLLLIPAPALLVCSSRYNCLRPAPRIDCCCRHPLVPAAEMDGRSGRVAALLGGRRPNEVVQYHALHHFRRRSTKEAAPKKQMAPKKCPKWALALLDAGYDSPVFVYVEKRKAMDDKVRAAVLLAADARHSHAAQARQSNPAFYSACPAL